MSRFQVRAYFLLVAVTIILGIIGLATADGTYETVMMQQLRANTKRDYPWLKIEGVETKTRPKRVDVSRYDHCHYSVVLGHKLNGTWALVPGTQKDPSNSEVEVVISDRVISGCPEDPFARAG